MTEVTAGTAGEGFRAERAPHPFQLDPRDDYGRRRTCITCGGERPEHVPTPRRALDQPVRRSA